MKEKCVDLINKNKDAFIYYSMFALTGLFVGVVISVIILLAGLIVRFVWR